MSDSHFPWLRVIVGVAAAVALITAGTLFGVSRGGSGRQDLGREPTISREVIESTLAVTAAAQTLQGTLSAGYVKGAAFKEFARLAFALDDNGRLSLAGTVPPGTPWPSVDRLLVDRGESLRVVRDAPARTTRWLFPDTGVALESSGQPAGEPSLAAIDELFPLLRLRAFLRQLLEGESPDMEDVIVDGHAAWKLTTVPAGGWGSSRSGRRPAAVTVVVDKQSRLPVRIRYRVFCPRAAWVELRFTDLRLDEPLPDNAFRLDLPAGTSVSRAAGAADVLSAGAFETIPFENQSIMRSELGALPWWPTWRPQGFALASATYRVSAIPGAPTVREATSVSLAYRRGMDIFFVSVALGGGGTPSPRAPRLQSPDASFANVRLRYPDVREAHVALHGGAFDGCRAVLLFDPGLWPQLRVADADHVAVVWGDLSRGEMVQVAESLGLPLTGE